MSADETERLIKMEEVLHGRVIGQEEAVSAISRAIRRARVGLKNPNRPIASFIFAGPTGAAGQGAGGGGGRIGDERSAVGQRGGEDGGDGGGGQAHGSSRNCWAGRGGAGQ